MLLTFIGGKVLYPNTEYKDDSQSQEGWQERNFTAWQWSHFKTHYSQKRFLKKNKVKTSFIWTFNHYLTSQTFCLSMEIHLVLLGVCLKTTFSWFWPGMYLVLLYGIPVSACVWVVSGHRKRRRRCPDQERGRKQTSGPLTWPPLSECATDLRGGEEREYIWKQNLLNYSITSEW